MRRSILMSLTILLVPVAAWAATRTIVVEPGERIVANTHNCRFVNVTTNAGELSADCEPFELYEGVPICQATHDPHRWHGLVERDAAGAVSCTYLHHHGDDPSALNDLFGKPGAWAGIDESISYPWQTTSMLGHENDAKHNFYKWGSTRDLPCKSQFSQYGFSAVRVQAHDDGAFGATTRFHSFSVEATACDPATGKDIGYIKTGGHLDYGPLFVQKRDFSLVHVPLSGDPATISSAGARRIHAAYPDSYKRNITWYGGNKLLTTVGINAEDVGFIDPADPSKVHPFPAGGPQGAFDHSWEEPVHLVAVNILSHMDEWDGVKDGRLKLDGFTDRYGTPVQNCGPVAPDCVPVDVDLKVGRYQYRLDGHGGKARDYDVKSPVTGKSLIKLPN